VFLGGGDFAALPVCAEALEEGDEALEGGLERIPDLELGDEEGGAPRANGGAPGHSGWQDQGPEPGDAVAGSEAADGS
jgi:hypothetical protein